MFPLNCSQFYIFFICCWMKTTSEYCYLVFPCVLSIGIQWTDVVWLIQVTFPFCVTSYICVSTWCYSCLLYPRNDPRRSETIVYTLLRVCINKHMQATFLTHVLYTHIIYIILYYIFMHTQSLQINIYYMMKDFQKAMCFL